MSLSTNIRYLMEHPLEGKRLAEKVDPQNIIDRYLARYLKKCRSFIDIGSGPCTIGHAISQRFPHIRVVCVDLNPQRLSNIHTFTISRHSLFAVAATIMQLPFQNNQFDFVFCRFLFQYLQYPENAVKEIFRILTPGGRLLIQDIDGQLLWHYPQPPELEKNIAQIIDTLKKYHFDPFVGRKIFHFLYKNKISDIQVQVEPYHLTWGKKAQHHIDQWTHKLNVLSPLIIEALGDEKKANNMIKNSILFFKKEETLMYSSLFSVTGTKSD